jgi:hypothetical protein
MLYFYNRDKIIADTLMANSTLNFYSTDDEESYIKNNKSKGRSWNYYNSSIEYKFNSLGYRTKEISNLAKNFLLTFGCSYSEGVGLHQNEIWTNYLAKDLNLDLYNHAKQATGVDIQFYNAMLWKINNFPIPKLVVVQWPNKYRKSFGLQKTDHIFLTDYEDSSGIDEKWWKKRYIQDTGELEINLFFWIESFNNLWKMLGVPVLNFTWDDDVAEHLIKSQYQNHFIPINNKDKARDLQHDGPGWHFETAEKIKRLLSLPNFTDKI